MINFSFVPGLIRALGGTLKALFFYKAGRDAAKYDFEKSLNEVLEEDAQNMANRPRADSDVIDRLQRAADSKD